jgi:AcrR family transcriptional regulator
MKRRKTNSARGRPRAFDPGKALDRAMQVFWRKGFQGTSLSDLTEAMGINPPSLYATFGNKTALFRTALDRYFKGPSIYAVEALQEPTARKTVERMFRGVIELLTNPKTPTTCMWVHGAFSCDDDTLQKEFSAQRAAQWEMLRTRFQRAVAEGDLPINADVRALASFVQTVITGMTVQATTGATHEDLLRVTGLALEAWPT